MFNLVVIGFSLVEITTKTIELLRRKKEEPYRIRLINDLVTIKEISKEIILLSTIS